MTDLHPIYLTALPSSGILQIIRQCFLKPSVNYTELKAYFCSQELCILPTDCTYLWVLYDSQTAVIIWSLKFWGVVLSLR
jgi:hypothetical protein